MNSNRVQWVEPLGPDCGPVDCTASQATVIAYQRHVGSQQGFEYPSDEAALDDFMVVHWAYFVAACPSQTGLESSGVKPSTRTNIERSNMENTGQYAQSADLWESRARRLAHALIAALDGVEDHDIHSQVACDDAQAEHIARARRDALTLTQPSQKQEAGTVLVAEDPAQPGCAYAGCIASERHAEQTLARWRQEGAIIRRVDAATAQQMMACWKPRSNQVDSDE